MIVGTFFKPYVTKAGCKILLVCLLSIHFSCKDRVSTKVREENEPNTATIAPAEAGQKEISVGGKRFMVADEPLSRYLFMGKDTAAYYFATTGDSCCIATTYTLPGGAIDVYEMVCLHRSDIDTAASGLNGITLSEGNANEFNILAKEGKTFRFVSYQKDSTAKETAATEARLIVKQDSVANRIASLLRISR